MPRRKATRPKHLFFNRDQSWLRFNMRVLEEAQDTSNPLLERLRFLAITGSNLDEFTEIRIAGILQRIEDGYMDPADQMDDGLSEQQRMDLLADRVHSFIHAQSACWTEQLLPALNREKIHILRWRELNTEQRDYAVSHYLREVDPLLTPITIDPTHPFPRVLNKALCMALLLHRKGDKAKRVVLGIVTVPRSLNRFVVLPTPGQSFAFLPLQELLSAHAEQMYPGYQVHAHLSFRITRNSNLYLEEEESSSLLENVRSELFNRRKGAVVRLEVESGSNEQIIEQLRINFDLDRWQVFRTDAPVNLSRIAELYDAIPLAHLKFPVFQPRTFALPANVPNIFAELRQRDILLHHPFDSFSTVEDFIAAVEKDERVVTAKQTLYRTTRTSPALDALMQAAEHKDVSVVIELMARFDEDSNIRWANALEEAGAQVFHGIVGYKTHCKLALIVRRDEDGVVRRYAHLGTGNYNRTTARFYTDISFFTARPDITAAVHRVFHYLTSRSQEESYDPLLVAPITLAADLIDLIAKETRHAQAGKPAHIIAKMNGLLDGPLVQSLYAASQAGVQIDLIVRGMCSLRPGIPGLSETIRVRSIVGRFLEHSRIFWFANAGDALVYCGSADWMPRNLHSRCEVLFPVYDKDLQHRLRHQILGSYLQDNTKARLLQPEGEYLRAPRTGQPFSAQEFLMLQVEAKPPSSQTITPNKRIVTKRVVKKSAKKVTKKR